MVRVILSLFPALTLSLLAVGMVALMQRGGPRRHGMRAAIQGGR